MVDIIASTLWKKKNVQLPIHTLLTDSMFAHRVASPFEQALHHRLMAPVCVAAVTIHIYLIRSAALILEI